MIKEIEAIITRYKRGFIPEDEMVRGIFHCAEIMHMETFRKTAEEKVVIDRSDFEKMCKDLHITIVDPE